MEQKICKVCKMNKEIRFYSEYTTSSGNKLRKSTCYSCYNKKRWQKRPLNTNKYDSRFCWDTASYEDKINHIKVVFESNVIKSENGCWDWNGSLHKSGYAVMNFEHKQQGAHRISWLIHKGIIKKNMFILHHCDNKKCTNIDHLYEGTAKNNAQDREDRLRRPILQGNQHPNSVLNEKKVKNIKKMINKGIPMTEIAKKYKCGKSTISAIKNGWTWKRVIIN